MQCSDRIARRCGGACTQIYGDVTMQIDLSNRTALVIGGCSDLGAAICRQLARSGAKVAGDYQDEEQARRLRETLAEEGIEVHLFAADLLDLDSCDSLVAAVEKQLGPVDIIINTPDFHDPVSFADMDKAQWDRVLSTNLDSVFNICRQIVEGMHSRGFGRIVNVASGVSRRGKPGHSHYGAAKMGLHGFTMSLAQELARSGVTVNTVSPGYIDSTAMQSLSEDDRRALIAGIPAARLGNAADVASLVDFLCSEQAGYITGADIGVNGGHYMH